MKAKQLPPPVEHVEACHLWTRAKMSVRVHPELALLFAVPNGGDRHGVVAAKLQAEGVCKGVPDYLLPVARGPYHGFALELKRLRFSPSDWKPEQRDWAARLQAQGWHAVVAGGADAAWAELMAYLALGPFRGT